LQEHPTVMHLGVPVNLTRVPPRLDFDLRGFAWRSRAVRGEICGGSRTCEQRQFCA
jgi:hypothetical protein